MGPPFMRAWPAKTAHPYPCLFPICSLFPMPLLHHIHCLPLPLPPFSPHLFDFSFPMHKKLRVHGHPSAFSYPFFTPFMIPSNTNLHACGHPHSTTSLSYTIPISLHQWHPIPLMHTHKIHYSLLIHMDGASCAWPLLSHSVFNLHTHLPFHITYPSRAYPTIHLNHFHFISITFHVREVLYTWPSLISFLFTFIPILSIFMPIVSTTSYFLYPHIHYFLLHPVIHLMSLHILHNTHVYHHPLIPNLFTFFLTIFSIFTPRHVLHFFLPLHGHIIPIFHTPHAYHHPLIRL